MSQAKMRASTSLRQFWLTHADALHFQIQCSDSSGCNRRIKVKHQITKLLTPSFIWAPPRTRPKFQHLCEHRKIFQPVSRMLILEIHNAVVAVPADVTSLGCHCPPNIFYASDCFFDIFHMMMTKVWYCHGHDLCPASRDLLRCPAIV